MPLIKTLLIGSILILVVACIQTTPIKPTKPTLNVKKQSDGGICLDRADTKALGEYILNLEQQYKK